MTTSKGAVVVYSNNGIGDFWLSLPALHAIRRHCGHVTLIAPALHLSVLPLKLKELLEVIPLPASFAKLQRFTLDELVVYTTGVDCDLLVSMATYESPAFRQLVVALSPRRVVGLFEEESLYRAARIDWHMGKLLFELARSAVRCRNLREAPFLLPVRDFSNESEQRASNIVAHVGTGRRILVVHTHGSEATKCLASNTAITVLSRFLERSPQYSALVVDPTAFPDGSGELPIFSLSGLSLPTAAAVVSRAHLALTVDSCFRHQADSLGVPTVALYAATSPAEWGRRHGCGIDLRFESMLAADCSTIVDCLLRLSTLRRHSRMSHTTCPSGAALE